MPKLPSSYKVEAFLDNNLNRIWRIEGLGEVDLNPSVPSEPSIEVILVPLWKPQADPETINKKSTYQYSGRRVVRVGVGLLSCLHIGTLWRGGYQLNTPPYTPRDFNELLITPETSRITDASRSPALITPEFYPAVQNCVKAKYLVIDLDQKLHGVNKQSKLIVPCVEVARFYYTNSTQLTRAIIGGGLDTHANDIYAPHKTRLPGEDGIGFVQLRDIIKDPDRKIVARLAFDHIANRNARNIYTSIIKNASEESCAVLEARPPFEGTTDLKVEGKWILSADEVWHFFVYRLVSCTAPFPYKQLDWGRDNDATPVGDPDPSRPVAYPGAIKRPVKPAETEEEGRLITHIEEPSLDYEVTDIEVTTDRFPDLRTKKPGQKFKNTENTTRAGNIRPGGPEEVNSFSTGGGEHEGNNVAPVSVTQQEDVQPEGQCEEGQSTRLPAGLNNFKDILCELEGLGNISTSLVLLDSSNGDSELKDCTYFPALYGSRPLKWSYINYDEKRRRQAMIAHCHYNNAHFYVMDIEVREDDENDRYSMLLLHDIALAEVGVGRLRAVLHFAAKTGGRWIREWELKNLVKERFKHDLNDTAKYAHRFFKAMLAATSGMAEIFQQNSPEIIYEPTVTSSDNQNLDDSCEAA
ncbi:MAG: hypothetical protein M3362_01360 [Acidobacteriota bacterium]|nr:hypothetical protein [Acidobacteriota bacterium]